MESLNMDSEMAGVGAISRALAAHGKCCGGMEATEGICLCDCHKQDANHTPNPPPEQIKPAA